MSDGSSAQQPVDSDRHRSAFLDSHRALSVCTRELVRLADEVVRCVGALGEPVAAEAKVRRSPERCIVQLGPVALTVGWLRGTYETVAAGELLVIVWRGVVAAQPRRQPERPVRGREPLAATPLWEQVLTAVGESDATWLWQYADDDRIGRCSSKELAARCVERLREAYVTHESVAGSTAPLSMP